MAVYQTIHYELSTPADLQRLLDDMAGIEADTVVVAFNPSGRWQPTDFQIARIVAAGRNNRKRLVAERASGSTAELAFMLGFNKLAIVSDRPELHMAVTSAITGPSEEKTATIATGSAGAAESSPGNEAEADAGSDDREFDSTADLATYRPAPADNAPSEPNIDVIDRSPADRKSTDLGIPVATPGFARPIAIAAAPANSNPLKPHVAQPRPIQVGRSSDSESGNGEPEVISMRRSRKRRGLVIAAAVLAPILVIVVVGAMLIYMLPTADVTIVPREETIASTLTYGITTSDSSYDISIDPTPISSTTSAQATREATGERFEPAGTASGAIQITNPLTSEVTVPAGTEIPGPNGVTYYTAEDAFISAADPYGSMSFGSGSVGIYAGLVGPDGNLDAGALTGQLGSQMFYTNPGAISGGRMDRFSVISEDDVDRVRSQVADELLERAEEDVHAEIPDGFEIVPGSLEFGDPEVEVSAAPGTDGGEVSASGTLAARARIFDPNELHELAGDEADLQLRRQGGNERILLAETVSLKDPTPIDGETPAYQINVEAIARTVITESEKQQIIDEITGLSREEAEKLLSDHPKVERFQIVVEPGWLLDRVPEISSRITIHVSSSEPTASR